MGDYKHLPTAPDQLAAVLRYGQDFLAQFKVVRGSTKHGAFITSCVCHGCNWPALALDHMSSYQHFANWFYGRTAGGTDSVHIDPRLPNGNNTLTGPDFVRCNRWPPRPRPPLPPPTPAPTPRPPAPRGTACPTRRSGCTDCAGGVDGRCPGMWCGQPCIYTSHKVGRGTGSSCFPANWWAKERSRYPAVSCTGNATGCHRTCGGVTPHPPSPQPPAPGPPPPTDTVSATYLTDYPRAKCLDGSPGYYYFRPAPKGSINATKWILHIQGGGWCDSNISCAGRTARYLGSSRSNVTGLPDRGAFTDILCPGRGPYCGGSAGVGSYVMMLNDPRVNEYTHDWNAVFLRYCDGMAFSANASAPMLLTNGRQLWFRGLEILKATFESLIQNHGLGKSTDVNLGGSSAGGHATYMQVDRMADWIYAANTAQGKPKANIVSMPDSGYWPESQRSVEFRSWFALAGSVADGLPKHCKWKVTNRTRCLFPEYFADEIETQLFPLQSLYDPDQHQHNKTAAFINGHGKWLLAVMNRTILQTKRRDEKANGAWIHSCTRHCGNQLLNIDGFTATTALETLLTTEAMHAQQKLFLQEKPFPCTTCCDDEPYPP